MGRMFRIVSEGGVEPPAPAAESIGRGSEGTMNPHAGESVPFVEVGGPNGVVSSPVRGYPVAAPPKPQPPKPFAPRPAPKPVVAEDDDARMLSVAFHKMPKPGLRLMPAGIAPEVVTYHYPDHPVSAEYRLVREEIRREFEAHGQRTVLFTAGSAAAGTTTVLLNVAVALAQESGSRVLVLDANLHRPAVAPRLGVADVPGLAEVLAQTVPLAWAVQTTAVPNLHVLAGGALTDRAAALLPVELPRLAAQLRQWFDWVLIDAGTWEETLGREGLSHAGDAVYLVTRHTDLERMEFHTLRGAVGANLRGYITTRH